MAQVFPMGTVDCKVAVVTNDTDDQGQDPDLVYPSGYVYLTPRQSVVKGAGPTLVVPDIISLAVNENGMASIPTEDGYPSEQTIIPVPAITGMTWNVTFDLRVPAYPWQSETTQNRVSVEPFDIPVEAGKLTHISDYMPAGVDPSTGATWLKGDPGAPGTGVVSAKESAGKLILTLGDGTTLAPVPLPASTVPGPPGKKGDPGAASTVPGPAGPRVTTAAVDTSGVLTLTDSAGNVITASGTAKGAQGAQGERGPAGTGAATLTINRGITSASLDVYYQPADAGYWDVLPDASKNTPPGLTGRGSLEVVANSIYAVTQRVTDRTTNEVYRRTLADANTGKWNTWVKEAPLGDSDTTNLAIIGDSLAASHNLRESLAPYLTGVSVYGRAWNGETTDGVAARLGALKTRWTITGNQIPASTAEVAITPDRVLNLSASDTYMSGDLAGVTGQLSWYPSQKKYTFRRTTAGTAVTVPALTEFIPTWTKATAGHAIGVIMGRNDVTQRATGVDADVPSHILANHIKLHDWLSVRNKVFFFLGTINRTTEPKGDEAYNLVVETNRLIKERFPGNFIDVRKYLVNQAIYDLGITPTSSDLANIAKDCPPPSVMADMTHYSDECAAMISQKLIYPWLQGKGIYP